MHSEGKNKGFGAALAMTAALSVPLVFVPVVGPFAASWAGCRGSGRSAIPASGVAAVVWLGLLWWVSGLSVTINGTSVELGPLVLVIPVVVGGLIAGGLVAAGGRGLATLGFAALLAGTLWSGYQFEPVVTLVREFGASAPEAKATNGGCPENLKRLYTAVRLYSDSWDEMLPPADVWMDRIAEYVGDESVLRCPSVASEKGYGYAMNDDVSAKALWELSVPETTPSFFDSSKLERNAHDAFRSLPRPGRHDGSNNVVYLDGHVKAIESP